MAFLLALLALAGGAALADEPPADRNPVPFYPLFPDEPARDRAPDLKQELWVTRRFESAVLDRVTFDGLAHLALGQKTTFHGGLGLSAGEPTGGFSWLGLGFGLWAESISSVFTIQAQHERWT